MQKIALILIVSVVTTCGLAQPAQALKQFGEEFLKYYKIDKKSEVKTDFAKTVIKAKCWVCHQGKKKKHNNPYGQELAKLLDKKKDKKDTKKIIEALEKVAKIHTDPKDKKSPTYGDLIKADKLPGGTLEEAKKKVEEEESSEAKGSASEEVSKKQDASDKK